MDEASTLVKIGRLNLAGHMQEGCAVGLRFDKRTGSIPRACSGAGDDDSKFASSPRVPISHIDGTQLTPIGDRPDIALSSDGVVDRNIMDADNARNDVNPSSFQGL